MATAMRPDTKTDLTELRPECFKASRAPQVIRLPEASYLALEGAGAPEQALPEAIGALYSIAYGLKFRLKSQGCDFKVCPVEAQWWMLDPRGKEAPDIWDSAPEHWHWRLLIMVPDYVIAEDVEAVKQSARLSNAAVVGVHLIRLEGEPAAQVMHVGPYEAEKPTIDLLRAFIAREGLEPNGRHTEVYLGDPRRTRPEKLRTILRQPVKVASS